MLWASLIVAVGLGTICGGWRSLHLAREGELQQAHRALHSAALVAGVCGGLLPWPVLGWPWSAVTVSVSEEVETTVIEPSDVEHAVSKWFFWTEKQIEHIETPRTFKENVSHDETRPQFRWLLLILMLAIGIVCHYAEKWSVFFAWWFVG